MNWEAVFQFANELLRRGQLENINAVARGHRFEVSSLEKIKAR